MRRSFITCFLILSALLIPSAALAEEAYSPEALEIANSLNCPVCQGQSARDSNSALARQMRTVIQEQLDAGKSRQEILDYFAEAYGVSVLREPPKSGFALTLWWTPVVALALGLVILATFIRQRSVRGGAGPGSPKPKASQDSEKQADDIAMYEEMIRRGLDNRERSPR